MPNKKIADDNAPTRKNLIAPSIDDFRERINPAKMKDGMLNNSNAMTAIKKSTELININMPTVAKSSNDT